MKKSFLMLASLIFFCFANSSRLQKTDYSGLLDKVVRNPEIISTAPLKDFQLDKRKISDYEEFLVGQGKRAVDSTVLMELIDKSANPDTSAWSDNDFRLSILVPNAYQKINADSTIKVLKRKGIRDFHYYARLIKHYNTSSTDDYSKNPRIAKIYQYSRPVFDESGKFAAIAYLLHKEGFGVLLYHLQDNEWQYLGEIYAFSF